MKDSRVQKLVSSNLFKSFLLFSIFRAFYGTGILIVTWLLATETDGPWWLSIIFLACSMVFSRVLFRWIKKSRKSSDESE